MTYESNSNGAGQGSPSSEGRGRGTWREADNEERQAPGRRRETPRAPSALETSPSLKRDAIIRDLEALAHQVPESIHPDTGQVDALWYAAARALRDRGKPVTADAIRDRLEQQGRGHAARR